MAIKKYYVSNPKPGFPYDRNARKYFSYGFDIWINGARRQERGFFTKQDAEAAVKALRSRGPRASRSPHLIELFQKKLDDMQPGPERSRAKRVFTDFLNCAGDKKIKVIDVKKVHFKTYTTQRMKAGVSAATVRREIVPIAAALNKAGEYFEALEDHRPAKIPWPQVPRARKHKTISAEERAAILNYLLGPRRLIEHMPKMYEARRRTGVFLQFCLLTASRPGEIAQLQRSNIDWNAGTVSIVGTKTRKTDPDPVRVLQITPTMAAILRERESKAFGDYLFFRGGKITAKSYAMLKEACEANDIPYGRKLIDGITFHTARHTATTELSRSGLVDTRTVGEFTGHADESMILYYTHAHPEMMQKAADHLEKQMGFPLYRREFLESDSENN
jgi:integrase